MPRDQTPWVMNDEVRIEREAGQSLVETVGELIVWLSGPTGSGKTSFGAFLATLGWSVVAERLPKSLFVSFQADPVAHCADLQAAIMRARFEQWDSRRSSPTIVFDRSVQEDFAVFCRLHHSRGLISDGALLHLAELSAELSSKLPAPDLIIYFLPASDVLHSRNAVHPLAIRESLDAQVALYQEWVGTRPESILTIDNSRLDLATLDDLGRAISQC